MGKYPVTQAQWKAVAGLSKVNQKLDPDPARFKGGNCPVERVSWEDAIEFCSSLSKKTGKQYRLPSEAEWEYACRAGTITPFHFGETLTSELANYDGKYMYTPGPNDKFRGQTTNVGSFQPNAFGLYDMHGNVWEWCQDLWHTSYAEAPSDGSAWFKKNDNDSRLLRGGSCLNIPWGCRSAFRSFNFPDTRNYTIGFRFICEVPMNV